MNRLTCYKLVVVMNELKPFIVMSNLLCVSVCIQANLEDDIVKEALKTVRQPPCCRQLAISPLHYYI